MPGSKSNAYAQNGKHILVVALQPKGPLLITFNMAATGSQGIRSESEASSLDESCVDLSSKKSFEISSFRDIKYSESANTRGRAQRGKLRHAKDNNKGQEMGVKKFA